MRIGHNRRFAEHIPHNQVGAFAPHAGQGEQSVKVIRHLAAVLVPQLAHTGRNIPRLAAAQPAGAHNRLNVGRVGFGQGLHAGVFGEQVLHHNVHPFVGALGGQPHFHQQLPGLAVIQRAVGKRVFLFQPRNAGRGQRL